VVPLADIPNPSGVKYKARNRAYYEPRGGKIFVGTQRWLPMKINLCISSLEGKGIPEMGIG
jgi:hypothetical protein